MDFETFFWHILIKIGAQYDLGCDLKGLKDFSIDPMKAFCSSHDHT